ncbi:Cathepsin S precursor, putative, partial [Perkinsus marinus ATCC 50983]
AMEGAFQIKTGHLPKFSVQQIVDCSTRLGNYGCDGGSYSATATYVNLNGLVSDKDYPYANKEQACNSVVHDYDKACLEVSTRRRVDDTQLDILIQELQFGPIAIQIFTDTPAFDNYRSGILDIPNCNGEPDHGMLLVGYGVDGGKP